MLNTHAPLGNCKAVLHMYTHHTMHVSGTLRFTRTVGLGCYKHIV